MKTRVALVLLMVCVVLSPGARTRANDADPTQTDSSVFLPLIQGSGSEVPVEGEDAAVPGQFVVVWEEDAVLAAPADDAALVDVVEPLNIDVIDVSELVDAGENEAAEDVIEGYKNNPAVAAVEPNYIYTISDTPNDTGLNNQWAWSPIEAYDAWDVTRGSDDVVIAIIDTGIQADHPDLDAKIVDGYDFVSDDDDPDDGNGHGTHVGGSAAAETNNGIGGAGVCPECKLMPLRALNNRGSGSLSDIARAITYAADNGADVINMSLGGGGTTTLQRAIDYAWEKGAFLTCSAGNDGRNRIYYPAGYDNCFAVASTTSSDARSSFSNYGSWVDVAAPGSRIYSSWIGSRYATLNGTSMAAPHVAGLAGLLSSQGLSNDEIRDQICSSADRISGTGSFWSCGRINALRAVEGGGSPLPRPSATTTPTAGPTNTPEPGETVVPEPTMTATPEPGETTTPEPGETTTPEPGETTTPTPRPTQEPGNSGVLRNGSFEDGEEPWVFSADDIRSTEQPFSGSYSAGLGGEDNSTDSVEQVVEVPADGTLTYRWYPAGRNDIGDRLRLDVTVGGSRMTVMTNSTNGRWYERTVDLSAFAGRTVTIKFSAVTNSRYPTTFYVDDVSLR